MNGQSDGTCDGTTTPAHLTKRVSVVADKIPEVLTISETNALRLDAEKLLRAFGKYGKYQMRSYILLAIPSLFYSSQMLIMGFITHAPPFQCVINPSNTSVSPSSPLQPDTYKVLDACRVLDLRTNEVVQCSAVPHSKYVYTESTPYSTLNSEFDLVCNDAHWAEHGSALYMLGGLLTPVITQLSDLYGRRIIFLLTLWAAGFSSILCSMAPTLLLFLICRLLIGIAASCCYAVIWIMTCESVAVEFRSLIPIGFTICWVFGIMMVGALRIWILNWRWLYFIISIPSVLTVFYYWLLPESPHWLISHNKQSAIEQYIEDACNYNNMKINLCKCASDSQMDNPHKTRTFMDILRCKVALFHLIVQCYVMTAMNMSYWGMALLSTTLSEDSFTGYFLSGFTELPGGLLAVLLLLKFGRRSISMWSFMMQSLLQSLAVLFQGAGTLQLFLAVAAKLFNCFIWAAQPLLLAEMSPTTIRNTFYGAVQFIAEIGAISAPYLYLLKSINPRAPQALVALFSFIAALVLLVAPETQGRAMPEDLDQFDPGCFLAMFGFRERRRRSVLLTPKEVKELRISAERSDEANPLKTETD